MGQVTIRDIAEELGVSTATVSNVIHGKTKKISEETVRRVQELLEKRQYIPNMAGILLAQNNSKIFGVVIHKHQKYEGHVLEDGFIAASLNALSEEIDNAGYFLMVKATTKWQEIPRFASMWNMAGIILIGFCEQDYQKLRDEIRVPVVIYDGTVSDGRRLVNLTIDDRDGGRQMGEHFRQLGHKQVLYLADNDIHVDHLRYLGLCEVYPEAQRWIVPMEKDRRAQFYRERLEEIRQYTAVFAASDYYAIDFIHEMSAHGLQVPKQISVAGFDNSTLSGMIQPSLTTIGQNHTKRAKLAVELLQKLYRKEDVQPEYLVPVELVVRESTTFVSQSHQFFI